MDEDLYMCSTYNVSPTVFDSESKVINSSRIIKCNNMATYWLYVVHEHDLRPQCEEHRSKLSTNSNYIGFNEIEEFRIWKILNE